MSDFQDDHDPGAVWRLPVSDTTILLVELTTGEPVLRQRDLLAPRADAVRPPSREYRGRRTGENSGPGPGWSVTGPDDSAGVEYDPAGRPVRHTDAAGAVTAFSWDDEHRLTGLTDAAGALVRLSYTAAGAVSEVVLEGVGRTGFTYQDEPSGTGGPAGSGGPAAEGTRTVVTDPLGRATAYTFDGHGRLLTVTDPLGGVHRQEWDPVGRLAAVVDRTGGRTAYEYDGHGRLVARVAPTSARSSVGYGDPAHPDLVTTLRDPAGNEVVLEHDTAGRVVRAGTPGTAGAADTAGAAGSLDRRAYDPVHGRISSVTNGAGHRTSFEYDAAGELVAVSPPAPRRRASYDYDEFGRVVAVTGGNGRRTAYRHDPVGRLVEVSGPGGVLLSQTHDPLGRIVRRAGAGWRYDYSWVATSAGSRLAAVVRTDDAGREEVRAEHGPDGALRSLTTAGGTTDYDYDPAGRLAGVRTPTGHQARFTRDAAGRALRIEFGGAVQEISYDAAGRRRALTLLGADGATLLSAEYDYRDPTGADGDRLRRLVLDGQATEYAYDPLGQLIQAGPTSYAYDAALNLVRLGETAFTIGAAGEVTRFGATEFDYDGAGNFVEEVNPTGSFRYSDTNQTVLGVFGGAIVADIAHDGLGQQTPRRVTETTVDGRTVTHVLTHGPLGVARVVDDGVPLDVVRLPDGTVLAVITAEGRLLWTVTDHQGSVLALVDEQGGLAARYGYTPHGAVTATGPDAATNPFRYRGAYQLLRSAHFLDNRLYNGYWGRFTQPDPTGRQYGPYTFADNDPLGAGLPGRHDFWAALTGPPELAAELFFPPADVAAPTAGAADGPHARAALAALTGPGVTPAQLPRIAEHGTGHTAGRRTDRTTAPAGPAGRANPTPKGRPTVADQIVIRVPNEVVVKVVDDVVDLGDPQIGQTGVFDDELYDEDGNLIGTSHGSFRIEYVRPGDGGLITYYTEDITLDDGTIHAEGWADFKDVKTSKWVHYPATGTGGRYAGLTGFRTWRMTGVRASAEARILLSD